MTIATLGIVSLIGATLGFRFKVLILFPALGLTLMAVAGIGIGRGDHGHEMILTLILIAATLQIGYFLGVVARTIVVLSVASAMRRIWPITSHGGFFHKGHRYRVEPTISAPAAVAEPGSTNLRVHRANTTRDMACL